MSKGCIIARGPRSFRVKIELPPAPDGKRRQHLETIRGEPSERIRDIRARARARMIEVMHGMARNEYVEHARATVRGYIEGWLASPPGLNPKTAERYRQLASQQIYPHLGEIELQRLDESHIQDWHAKLLTRGGMAGQPLSARTVGHAHRLLHVALQRAVTGRKVARNVCDGRDMRPPKANPFEVKTLRPDQIEELLSRIRDHRLYTPAVVALGTGLRRGEILALRWRDIDLDKAILRVERSLGEAGEQLYIKGPKSAAGRRSLSLPPFVTAALSEHRRQVLEVRMALGQGRMDPDDLIFTDVDGNPWQPDKVSRDWANIVRLRKLPRVSFHGLRHTHVSLLIAGGLDVHAVSKRIGHGSAALTLSTYTHQFHNRDAEATAAIEAALGTKAGPR